MQMEKAEAELWQAKFSCVIIPNLPMQPILEYKLF